MEHVKLGGGKASATFSRFVVSSLPVLLLFASFCASAEATVGDPRTMAAAYPAYAITDHLDLLNASECRTELKEFREATDRRLLWSLRMLDANGVPSAGFVNGNNYWLGERQQCVLLEKRVQLGLPEKVSRNYSNYRNPEEEFPPFPIRFYAAHFRHNSVAQYHLGAVEEDVIALGLCLPASCSRDHVATILTKTFEERTLLMGDLYNANFTLLDVKAFSNDHQWLGGTKIVLLILLLTAVLGVVIAGTMYDLLVYQKRLKKKIEFLTFENNNGCELKQDVDVKRDTDQEEAALSDLKPENGIGKFLLCFSVYSNMQHVLDMSENTDSVPAVHGMKFWGMIWVVLAHTILFGGYSTANKTTAILMTDNFAMQVISNATFSVDTFFCVSGFLLSHLFTKAQQRMKKILRFQTQVNLYLLAIVKRFIRLSPAYFLMLAIVILNFSWIQDETMYRLDEPLNERCSKYWWRNVLYINIFFDWDSLCMSWSWYLTNDMYFFIYGTFLLMLSVTHYFTAAALGVLSLIGSILANAYVAYTLDYTLTLKEQYGTLSILYIRPWLRIPPFLIGMAVAQVLAKWDYKLHLSRKALAICWTLAILCNCSILFGTVLKPLPLGLSITYTALSRACWGVGVAWLLVACCTNNAGIINNFLSLKAWVPLSRLTYCVYLINPFIILSIFTTSNYPIYVDVLSIGSMFVGLLTCSYICALPLSLIAEVPTILLLRMLYAKNRIK